MTTDIPSWLVIVAITDSRRASEFEPCILETAFIYVGFGGIESWVLVATLVGSGGLSKRTGKRPAADSVRWRARLSCSIIRCYVTVVQRVFFVHLGLIDSCAIVTLINVLRYFP